MKKKETLDYSFSPKDLLKKRPGDEYFTHESRLTSTQVDNFEALMSGEPGENKIHSFLAKNPAIFTAFLSIHNTGHHGSWVLSKQMIKPKMPATRGLIPDFIIVGKNSDGYEPWIVELKSRCTKMFVKNSANEVYLSPELNKGVCQLVEYLHYAAEYKDLLCNILKTSEVRLPKGVILIGNQEETLNDEAKRNLKYKMGQIMSSQLQIRTYDSILRVLRPKFDYFQSNVKPVLGKMKILGSK
jgi:hypothetical protein